jgi:hypothetical protein
MPRLRKQLTHFEASTANWLLYEPLAATLRNPKGTVRIIFDVGAWRKPKNILMNIF